MKLFAAALIFPFIFLGPILDDKEKIFFGKASDHYNVIVDEFNSIKIQGEPFVFRVTFRPYPPYGFRCNDWETLRFVMPKELFNASDPYVDYEKSIVSEYCYDIQELRWDLYLNSYKPGKHKINLHFRFEFCTNIEGPPGYICIEEHRQVITHITVDKRTKRIP